KSIEKVNNSSLLSSTSRKNDNKKSIKKQSFSTSLLQIPIKRRLHLTNYHTNDNTNHFLSNFIIHNDQLKKENK
ncbi:unnamed protein product, partial [Rotaria sp. Silwood1]